MGEPLARPAADTEQVREVATSTAPCRLLLFTLRTERAQEV